MSFQGFLLDVFYTDSSGWVHPFLLEVDSIHSTWTLWDARLSATGKGVHKPPGIDSRYGITGTAFYKATGDVQYFVLGNFLAVPYYAGKYGKSSTGLGQFVNPPSVYVTALPALKWQIAGKQFSLSPAYGQDGGAEDQDHP